MHDVFVAHVVLEGSGEWLRGMTCAKYLEYDAASHTYRLPDEHAFLPASDETDHLMVLHRWKTFPRLR